MHLFQVKPKRKKHIQASLIPLLILKIIFDRELLFKFSLIFIAGCKTTSMKNIKPIPITKGITSEEVINALISSADADPKVKRRRGPLKSYEDGNWSVEDATDNFVILVYSLGRHSAHVKYEIKEQEIIPTVISSEYLLMTKDRIHNNAVIWINRHGITIREAMWKIKHSKKIND